LAWGPSCHHQASLKTPIATNFIFKHLWDEGAAEAVCPDEVQKISLKNLFKQNKLFSAGLVMEPTRAQLGAEDGTKQIVRLPVSTKDPKRQNAEKAASMIIANRRGRFPPAHH
jgi:hypothetical protein